MRFFVGIFLDEHDMKYFCQEMFLEMKFLFSMTKYIVPKSLFSCSDFC